MVRTGTVSDALKDRFVWLRWEQGLWGRYLETEMKQVLKSSWFYIGIKGIY